MFIQTYQSSYGYSSFIAQKKLPNKSANTDLEYSAKATLLNKSFENIRSEARTENIHNVDKTYPKKRTKRDLNSSSSNNIVSDAYNFKDLTQQVDPRTGAFSVSYKIVDVSGVSIEDPVFPLQINYNSLSQSDIFGLGKGWSWNLTRYDVQSETLYLSSGGSYKLQYGSENILQYYKLKDIKVTKDENIITINYKDGREEIIEKVYGNLVKMTNAEGFSVEFFYQDNIKLQSIEYKSIFNKEHPKRVEVFYLNDSVSIKHFDGRGQKAETLLNFKSEPFGTLKEIQNPVNQIISFKYSSMLLQNREHILLSHIKYPSQFEYAIEYLDNGLKTLIPGISVPAVSRISTINFPGVKDGNINHIRYRFSSENNYLGYGVAKFIENADALFSTANTYEYTSTEKRKHPRGHLKINRTYNHFHMLISESIFLNNELQQRKEYKYLPWQDRDFNNLETAYHLPIETVVIYYDGKGQSRKEITKNTYDDYGNLITSINSSGLVKNYKYLSAAETFNNIPHLIEREVTSSIYEKKSTVVEYQYETVQLENGKKYQRAIKVINKYSASNCDVNNSNCGTIYKTQINSYSPTNLSGLNDKIISLPVTTQTTAIVDGKEKTSSTTYKYEINSRKNSIYKNHIVSENADDIDYIATEYVIYNANSKKKIKEKKLESSHEISYHYDKIGRLTKETVGLNTTTPRTTSFRYILNSPLKGQSTLLTTWENNHKTKVIYDSMGREIEKWSQDEDQNNFVKIASYNYDMASQKSEEILYNIDANGSLYNLRISYKYDIYNRNILIKLPDGTRKYIKYDDANNTQTRYTLSSTNESSPINITVFNNNQQPVSSKIVLGDNKIHTQSYNYFDGFGNLIESKDVNGVTIKYIYNEIGNKVSEKYNNKKIIHYSYDALFKDKITEKSITLSNGTKYVIGKRKYNSLGQLVAEIDPEGRAISYKYNESGKIIRQVNRDGQIIHFKYDDLNRLIEKSVEGITNIKTLYTYDSKTSLITQMIDESGMTVYHYYANGKQKSIVYPNNNEVFYKYDLQGKFIYIKDVMGNKIFTNYNKITGKKESITYQRIDNDKVMSEKYHYDVFGRMDSKLLANDTLVEYAYDKIGNLKELNYLNNLDELILSYSYEYYKDSNLKSKLRKEGQNKTSFEQYKYDDMNNLLQYICSGQLCPKDQNGYAIKSEEYTFDDMNNIKTVSRKFIENFENITTYFYSEENKNKLISYANSNSLTGNTMSQEFVYDANGNIIKDENGNMLSYNAFNRLIAFENSQLKSEYLYNGEGILVAQKDNNSATVNFYYHENKLINEISENKSTSYFVDGNNLIAKINFGSEELFYLTDHAKSIIKIQQGQNLLNISYSYTPYGYQSNNSETEHLDTKSLNEIGFNGDRSDSVTGFQFLGKGYRAYNPVLGRFMQYDNHQSPYEKGGINGYIFAANNPIMKFDPSGENPEVYFGIGLTISFLGIMLSLFTFGTTLAALPSIITATVAADLAVKSSVFAISLAATSTSIAGSVYNKFARDAAAEGKKDAQEQYLKVSSNLTWASIGLGLGASVLSMPNAYLTTKELFQKSSHFEKTKFISHNVLGKTSDIAGITSLAYKDEAFRERANGNIEGFEYNINKAINFGLISLGTGVFAFGFDLSSFAKKQYKDYVNPKKQQDEEKLSLLQHDSLDLEFNSK
ncbi:RHS repeat domain-containing protein [Fluviispira vulneris]|uniref:RHS repeat domain-containing protein n=1 Tax=Fluviispira vulneris TaxID=2763012 RepID=UPI00164454B9|nr:RHS repeat-associated core domain-containing protein [Fluviispira vulneris]